MVHPRELCARYPRIANRFALLWPDAHLTEHYFEALLIDKRGNRRGFTTRITEELQHLRSFHREQHGLKTKDTATQNRLFELLRTVVGAPLPKGDQPA